MSTMEGGYDDAILVRPHTSSSLKAYDDGEQQPDGQT